MVRRVLLSAGIAGLAMTVAAMPALADPMERYAELQAVGEAVNDPDPLMRLALLEEIIAKGDATEVQLAIRTAFTIDDPNIRSLGLRTHFASFRTVLLAAQFPPEVQSVLDAGNEKDIAVVRESYAGQFYIMQSVAGVFKLRTEYADPADVEFTVFSMNDRSEPSETASGLGNIKGSLITLQSGVSIDSRFGGEVANCTFELSKFSGFTVQGIDSCDTEGSVPFPVTLHLFEPDEG